jgi:hypothetical protein
MPEGAAVTQVTPACKVVPAHRGPGVIIIPHPDDTAAAVAAVAAVAGMEAVAAAEACYAV